MSEQVISPATTLNALEIDVRCALELARAAIKGVISISPKAEEVVMAALEDAAEAMALDGSSQAPAVRALLDQVRHELAPV